MSTIVIISFGALVDDLNTILPEAINMEFADGQEWDALEYFTTSVKYFEDALKWDPNFQGVGVNAALYQNGNRICRKLIRR